MKRIPVVMATVAALVAACGGAGGVPRSAAPASTDPSASSTAPPTAVSSELTVFAAASLKGALEQAVQAFEAANPGTTVVVSTDSSAALETKIEQGAPADVFLSADTANPQKLVDGGFAAGEVVPFAGNELTIVVPDDNPGGVTSPVDLARPGLRVVAAGDEVPITRYAVQVVDKLAALDGYPLDFADRYAANVVSREENVSAVMAKIELGEGDAAIVYVTDAKASAKVATIPIPAEANVPATYAGVVVKASPNVQRARDFLAWFAGPDGQAILAGFGFLPPPG